MSGVEACWSAIGVTGDRSCPQLVEHVHCRNCPVYADAARTLLDIPSNPTYLAEWTAHVATPKAAADAGAEAILIFRLGDEWLGLPSSSVQEVAGVRPIHSLPHRRNGTVLGLTNVRGELLVCVSLGAMLGLAPARVDETAGAQQPQRLLVIRSAQVRVACPVDEVQGIHRVKPSDIKRVPATVAHAATYSRGVLGWQNHTVGVLNESRLFSGLERSMA